VRKRCVRPQERCVRSQKRSMPVASPHSVVAAGTPRWSRMLSHALEHSAVAHTFSHQDPVRSTEPANSNYPPPQSGGSIR
jgi:hypothetical protein